MKWEQGEWQIHLNGTGSQGTGWCLRHMACKGFRVADGDGHTGHCSCSKGECYNCKIAVPEEIKGFFELVKWTR